MATTTKTDAIVELDQAIKTTTQEVKVVMERLDTLLDKVFEADKELGLRVAEEFQKTWTGYVLGMSNVSDTLADEEDRNRII